MSRKEDIKHVALDMFPNGNSDCTCADAFVLGATYADNHPMPKWVNARKEKPQRHVRVVMCLNYGVYLLGFYDSSRGMFCDIKHGYIGNVKYWMPIPNSPIRQDEECY